MNTTKFLKFHLLNKGLQTKEELNIAHANLKEYQEIITELRGSISENEAQGASTQDTAKSAPELQGEVSMSSWPSPLLSSFSLEGK